ncbi:MAG: histidine kinase [Bdellovibrio sp. CG12_big_fil_rev_8_21_14_0_65_39_13]|nr:MAG: histidine kinase [Bdellovibrio sp. CG22_combo_CG10-13_8_21_14_all_39_27]PIQ59312.1 MAG: histidine kinase [Bdellovibrio sp. CG12_big_fil_rev_8_21_14_0_65_39_13]PIR32323.1 MAG: histidine kinase [Bdellovibrio sp. CG11_big_fil_rev_8_21_14_0_20_39_38]
MKKSAEEKLKSIQEMTVDEFATPCNVWAESNTGIAELNKLMIENGIRHLPIIQNERMLGIVSDRDIRNLEASMPLRASDIMSEAPFEVNSGALLSDVVLEMSARKLGSVLVFNPEDRTYSIFTSIDALNCLNEILRDMV